VAGGQRRATARLVAGDRPPQALDLRRAAAERKVTWSRRGSEGYEIEPLRRT
jgi:hypothetical protein